MSAVRSQALLAGAGLVLTMMLWGSMFPAIKIMLEVWDPFSISAMRFGVAALVLWAALVYAEKRLSLDLDARHWKLGLMVAGFATCFTLGIANSHLVSAALIGALGPFIATILAWLYYREPPPKGIWFSIPLAIGGAVLASQGENVAGGIGFRGGELFMTLGQICWSSYSLASQRWLKGTSQLRITTTTMATSTVFLALVAAGAMATGFVPVLRLDPTPFQLATLVWIGVVASTVGIYFWNIGARDLGTPVSSLYINLVPVFAILFGLPLGVSPTLLQLAGGAMVIAAVAQMQLRRLAPA